MKETDQSAQRTARFPKTDIPFPRDSLWLSKHEHHKELLKNRCDIVMIGDSIAANSMKSTIWRNSFCRYNILNFGIGGDRVENVLFRLMNGAINNRNIMIVVLMVGTNNCEDSAYEVFAGILECIHVIQHKLPRAIVVLPTILPRQQFPGTLRRKNAELNEYIIELGHVEQAREPIYRKETAVKVVHIHEGLINDNGEIYREYTEDFLHLSDAGYTKCFEPIYQKLHDILGDHNMYKSRGVVQTWSPPTRQRKNIKSRNEKNTRSNTN